MRRSRPIIGAVAPGAAIGAVGFEQATRFVQAQRLHAHADQFGGHRDGVDAAVNVEFVPLHLQTVLSSKAPIVSGLANP